MEEYFKTFFNYRHFHKKKTPASFPHPQKSSKIQQFQSIKLLQTYSNNSQFPLINIPHKKNSIQNKPELQASVSKHSLSLLSIDYLIVRSSDLIACMICCGSNQNNNLMI